jgi:hypothetical protein
MYMEEMTKGSGKKYTSTTKANEIPIVNDM